MGKRKRKNIDQRAERSTELWGEPKPPPEPKRIPEPVILDELLEAEIPAQAELDAVARGPSVATGASPLTPRQKEYIRELLLEGQRRRCEALRIYEPLPSQTAFHMSRSRQRICRGSNRAGKTLATMVELAWAVTGQHPDPDKYPKENGRAYVVARDLEKVGEVCWRKLGRAGAFQMIKDNDTGFWRARRPTDTTKGKAAPPLIPPRMIKDISWENKKGGIPKKVILFNGWEINFYSSKSDPNSVQGVDIDIAVFDEEVLHHDWFPEIIARLIDRKGWFWWGATPQAGTQQLFDLHLQAEQAAENPGDEVPRVTEHFLSIWDNVHLDEQAKQDFANSIDDEDRRVRIDGEFALSGLRIFEAYFYPRGVHGIDPFPVPYNWTRVLAIDPGAQVGAVLFAAMPPLKYDDTPGIDPKLYGDFIYLYDEIYLRGCDARRLATAVRQHVADQFIATWLIDHHGGNLTEIGSGKTPEQQYKESLRALKAVPKDWSGFTYGSDDVDGRILRIREFLRVREDGTPKLRFLRGTVNNFVREMERYQWKVTAGVVTDKPRQKDNHLVDCCGYLVMYPGLKYRKSKASKPVDRGAYESFKALRDREKRRGGVGKELGVTLA